VIWTNTTAWYPDPGATHHFTPNVQSISSPMPYQGPGSAQLGNGTQLQIQHLGDGNFASGSSNFSLRDILHVPSLKTPLLSVQQFCRDNNCYFVFDSFRVFVNDRITHKVLLQGQHDGSLYKIVPTPPPTLHSTRANLDVWHQRLSHPHVSVLRHVVSANYLPSIISKFNKCRSCVLGKASRNHLVSTYSKSKCPLELIHSDVWGPAPVSSYNGHKYFVFFIDDFSRFIWFYPIKHKSEVADTFQKFHIMVEKQIGHKIKYFQSDFGGEFQALTKYFVSHGIHHRRSCPHTRKQNGTAERKIRHIVDTGLTLLAHGRIPLPYWNFAFSTAIFTINHIPSKTHGTSPL